VPLAAGKRAGPRLLENLPMDNATRGIPVLRIFLILLVGVGLCFLIYYAPAFLVHEDKVPDSQRLKMGGTSTADIIIENRWRNAYRKAKGMEIDYESTGSTNGVRQMTEGKYAIAFTHAPMTAEQRKEAEGKGGAVVQVPVVLCAVVPVYNLPALKDKTPVKFTGEVLADIFLGKIDRWNDPALKKLNEGVDLPDTKITVVHREDSSGTTFLFTDYLSGASAAWREKLGAAASEVKWPVGVGQPRNQNVKGYVQRTEGAIGYVDLVHAMAGDLDYGAVQNKDGTAFIHVEAPNMTAAARQVLADLPEDLAFNLTSRPGKDSYPICGAIWAVCYQAPPGSNGKKAADFLHWATHEGQGFAENMAYAPLPEELVPRVDQKLQSIKQ
jgi:phosphate transport system substrate-binding protein